MNKWISIGMLVFLAVFVCETDSFAERGRKYTGQVVDIQTGQPIEGASVFMYWTKIVYKTVIVQGQRLTFPETELLDAQLKYTDKNGRYLLSIAQPSGEEKFDSGSILLYEPGYKAYRETVRFDDKNNSLSDHDLSNGQKMALERVPANFDHGKHYEFIEQALSGIEVPDHEDAAAMTWNKHREIKLKSVPEKAELLRRAEWEQRRSREDLDK